MLKKFFVVLVGLALFLSVAPSASASHSWGEYHWARTNNPFNLKLGDNVSSTWDPILATTSSDWSVSSILDTSVVPGGSNPKNCKPVAGKVEVCNSKYGRNGWLGIAQIWITGGVHITQGITKLNDTYFSTPTYNTTAWRNLVTCQEVGHTIGLDHQDENFDNANLGTCMDYTSNPETNQHPNLHDYQELETIYAHFDVFTTLGQLTNRANLFEGSENASDWGRLIRTSGRLAIYERDFGFGNKVVTHVIWAE